MRLYGKYFDENCQQFFIICFNNLILSKKQNMESVYFEK